MQLSIIVPVYKVEPYVEKCLRSLMAQDLPPEQYEVIVINDGSPDNSREVVLRLQQEFSNIILLEQENKGVSVARNNGFARAQGRYILCIDPDDYILPNTLARVSNKAEKDNLDVLYLGFTILGETGIVEYTTDYAALAGQVYIGVDTYFKSRGSRVRDPDRSVGILYSNSFLKKHGLSYPVDVPFLEDGLFLAKVLCLAPRCAFDHQPFYQRTTRPGSATHSSLYYSEIARKGFIKAAVEIQKFASMYQLNKAQQYLINQATAKFVLLPLQSCIADKARPAFRDMVAELRKIGLQKLNLAGCMPVYANLGKVYNLSTTLFYNYYPFYAKVNKLLYEN